MIHTNLNCDICAENAHKIAALLEQVAGLHGLNIQNENIIATLTRERDEAVKALKQIKRECTGPHTAAGDIASAALAALTTKESRP